MNHFTAKLQEHHLPFERHCPHILQINVGKLCNLTCTHCHVNAGPKRKEIMTRETVDRILHWLEGQAIFIVDLTGGAPEMIPDFRYFIEALTAMSPRRHIIDRCNLTLLLEHGYEDLGAFFRAHRVEIIASMPCYSLENVNAQRGEGVFEASIQILQQLNQLGYGKEEGLDLHLVYNPVGAYLPGNQAELEADYKRELQTHFGVVFNRLYTLTNLPIARFAAYLRHQGKYEAYLDLLMEAFNPATVSGLMCRETINVGWQGEVYDCDFNQQLGLQLHIHQKPLYLWDLNLDIFQELAIVTGNHCFGCTAGSGSSCGGAIT